uniref:Uncharacterized protein n=2 Tax=Rhodnius prolixus TaxID=13249 RepID=A0A905QWB1_RHOPR
MASQRLEKFKRRNSEVNKIFISDEEKLSKQTPQDLIREWFKCICLRPSTNIECSNINCGFKAFGRVRRLCRAHPTVTYLLDLQMCPNCLQTVHELPSRNDEKY